MVREVGAIDVVKSRVRSALDDLADGPLVTLSRLEDAIRDDLILPIVGVGTGHAVAVWVHKGAVVEVHEAVAGDH